jgi:tungstate transport system ATP-binding protein
MRSGASADAASMPAATGSGGSGGALLRLRAVGLRIGALDVLAGVDLDLPLDGRTVVVGPNGAGKSSLLQVVHGLVVPSAGSVAGVGADGAPRAPRLALVFQRPVMLRRSVQGNVEHALRVAGVPPGQRSARAAAALADVGLAALADRAARRLSGGEQQRLAIARAQALEPECLLLDEPTSSLDPAAGAAIERHLLALSSRGCGLVMSTHDLAQARRIAQRIVLMHRGRVVEAGEAAAFFAGPRTETGRRFLAGDWLE